MDWCHTVGRRVGVGESSVGSGPQTQHFFRKVKLVRKSFFQANCEGNPLCHYKDFLFSLSHVLSFLAPSCCVSATRPLPFLSLSLWPFCASLGLAVTAW